VHGIGLALSKSLDGCARMLSGTFPYETICLVPLEVPMQGRVTSSCASPNFSSSLALQPSYFAESKSGLQRVDA